MSPADGTTIRGPEITLRDWRVSDLDPYARWLAPGHRWQDPDAPYYAKPTSDRVPELVAKKRDELDAKDLPTPRNNLVVAHVESNELVGMVNRAWESRETNWPTLWIVLYDPGPWGRGLWSEHLLRRMAELARLDLRTWSGNTGMMRLAPKLGYAEEARFRKARIVDGKHYDGLGYGVLREEWERRHPAGFSEHLRRGAATG